VGIFDFFKPNVEKLEKQSNIPGLVKALRYKKDPEIRKQAGEVLRKIGDEKAIDGLIYSIENEVDTDIKIISISALENIPAKKAVPPLINCLTSRNYNIRKSALGALKKNADGSAAGLLLESLRTKTYESSTEAEELLLHIAGYSEFEILKTALAEEKLCRYAARAIGNTGNKNAVALLIPLLEDKSSLLRSAAAYSLGNLGDNSAVEPLLKLLKDESGFVSDAAIIALGKIGNPKANTELISLLKSYSTKEDKIILITSALGNTGGKDALEALMDTYAKYDEKSRSKFLTNKTEIYRVITSIKKALDKLIGNAEPEFKAKYAVMKQDGKMIESLGVASVMPLLELYKNNSTEKFAGEMLNKILESHFFQNENEEEKKSFLDKLLPVLLKIINDNSLSKSHNKARSMIDIIGAPAVPLFISFLKFEEYRYTSKIALGKIGEPAVEPLISALKDNNPEVRSSAVSALGTIRSKLSVEPVINLLSDTENKVVEEAVIALGRIKDERGVEPLVSVAENSNDLHVRKAALKALGDMGDKRGTDILIMLLGNDYLRNSAASALGDMGDERTVEPLLLLLNHNDEETRKLAAEALGKLKDKKAVKPLCDLLKDPDSYVRETAVKALGNMGSSEAVDYLIEALSDTEEAIQKSAVEVLDLFEDARAAKPLFELLKNKKTGFTYIIEKALDKICHLAEPEVQAGYAVHKKKWGKAVSLGKISIEPLLEALTLERYYREDVIKALEKLGVPSDAGTRALYLVAKRKWDNAALLGETATAPLLQALGEGFYQEEILYALGRTGDSKAIPRIKGYLHSGDKKVRQSAARALSYLYRSGKLNDKDKQAILEVKGKMEKKHDDHTFYSDCNDHKDNMGIGVYL